MAENNQHELWTISAVDGRYAPQLRELALVASEGGLFLYRLQVESRWLQFLDRLVGEKILPLSWRLNPVEKEFLGSFLRVQKHSQILGEIKTLEQTTNHDVKATEYYLAAQLRRIGAQTQTLALVHFACTSEDINNLSYALMLSQVTQQEILPHMQQIIEALGSAAARYSDAAMLARTHGQSASPTTLGKEYAVFGHRLLRVYERLCRQEFRGKFNGAVGNFNAHTVAFPTVDWLEISRRFVEDELGLVWNKWTTQIEDHDFIAEFCDTLRLYHTISIDLAQDCWRYISQGYLMQKPRPGEVGSSTMPHKINPIAFENAEGQFGLASALAQFFSHKLPISRLQRDLSDSTVLRSLGTMLGHHLLAEKSLLRGLKSVSADAQALHRDLAEAWEVLAEAVQTILRRYGRADAYELLKACTQGKAVDPGLYQRLAGEIPELPPEARALIAELLPQNYTGIAGQLAKDFAAVVRKRFASPLGSSLSAQAQNFLAVEQ